MKMDEQSGNTFSFDTYISPLTWRYGSNQMRKIFSERHKYELWRRMWVSLARAQHALGLVSRQELDDLVAHEQDISTSRIMDLERETRHDVMAAIREFSEKAPVGGGKIHVGATSMDIVDNADTMRTVEALAIIKEKFITLRHAFAQQITSHADTVCMGYTHLQPAEPTTVGYRLAFYGQELLLVYDYLLFVLKTIKTKGMKGAVGTQASYEVALGSPEKVTIMENRVLKDLGLTAVTASSQVHTRLYDYVVLNVLSAIGAACAKFAADVRLMQSPGIGEWAEPFGTKQVGSTAMPFKKNPVTSEKICSLARYIDALPSVALGNARHSYLERTLDDSANKRIIMAEAFLCVDEILTSTYAVISGLQVFEERVAHNLSQFGPFAATEAILMEAVRQGADRQHMHEVLRTLALAAWNAIASGKPNPMEQLLLSENKITSVVPKDRIKRFLDPRHHIGTAPRRARKLAQELKSVG